MRPHTSLCCGALIVHTVCSNCGKIATPENICKHCGYDKSCHNWKTWQCDYDEGAPGPVVWAETIFEPVDEAVEVTSKH